MSYLYSINRVVNIDNGKTNYPVVFSADIDTVYANLNDDDVSSQLRVVGGTWTDDMIVRNIKSHTDGQGGDQNTLNIGDDPDTITVKSTTLSMGSAGKAGSSVTLSGKTVDAGETDSTVNVKGSTISVGSGNTNAVAVFDEGGNRIALGTTATENVAVDGHTTTLTAITKVKAETPLFLVNEGNNAGYMKIDKSGVVQLGGSGTTNTDIYGNATTLTATGNAFIDTPTFTVQEEGDNVYFKMDDDSSNIVLGTDRTATLGFKGKATTLTATASTNVVTPMLNIQSEAGGVHLKMDEANSNIALGTDHTATLGLKGKVSTLTATASANVVTPILNIQSEGGGVHLKMDEANSNIVLGTDYTSTLGLKGKNTTLTSTASASVATPIFSVQQATGNVHMLLDEANSNISLGTNRTATFGLKGKATTLTATASTSVATPIFSVQQATGNVHMLLDEANSNISLGTNRTATFGLKGKATTITATDSINNNTKLYEINSNSDKGYIKVNNDSSSSTVQVGGSGNNVTAIHGNTTTIHSSSTSVNATSYSLNNDSNKAYFKADQTSVLIGSATTTEVDGTDQFTATSKKINMVASEELSFDTPSFGFNTDSTHAKLVLDESDTANSTVTIGGDDLVNTRIHGKNVIIGEVGQTTTIYGNLVAYSQGSNIISNTVVSETSAFHVHNTGTETALTVIQDNSVGGEKDLAMFITRENQDRAPFRIDKTGHVGMGVLRTSDVKAWLHIHRNDPDSDATNNDMFLVEDTTTGADTTPFIIKNDGKVGIGTNDPQYKVDIFNDDSTVKGIAIRDSLYVKTDDVNKVFYNIGGSRYTGTDALSECEFGFNINWDNIPVNEKETYIFRVSVKFHVAKLDGGVGFRRAELFITPNGPGEALITEVYDSAVSTLKLDEIVITGAGNNGVNVKIPWTNTDTTNTTTRAYMDMEIFSNQALGDFTITKHTAIVGSGVGTFS